MSGLFSRLAQQHINQRPSSIKYAQSPVFPMDSNEHNTATVDVEHEPELSQPILTQNSIEPNVKKRTKDTAGNDYVSKKLSVVNNSIVNEVDSTGVINKSVVTPIVTPVLNTVSKHGSVKEEITSFSTTQEKASEVELSIKPASQKSNELEKQFISNDTNESSVLKTENEPLKNSSTIRAENNNQQLRPGSTGKRSTQADTRYSQKVQAETQTTINVSIGQIEIRATQEQKDNKKTPVRSYQTRSSALEEYHQKRVRGEQ